MTGARGWGRQRGPSLGGWGELSGAAPKLLGSGQRFSLYPWLLLMGGCVCFTDALPPPTPGMSGLGPAGETSRCPAPLGATQGGTEGTSSGLPVSLHPTQQPLSPVLAAGPVGWPQKVLL